MQSVEYMQGVEKPVVSKMLEKGSNRRAYAVDTHAGLVGLSFKLHSPLSPFFQLQKLYCTTPASTCFSSHSVHLLLEKAA